MSANLPAVPPEAGAVDELQVLKGRMTELEQAVAALTEIVTEQLQEPGLEALSRAFDARLKQGKQGRER